MKTIVLWGLYRVPPVLGNYQNAVTVAKMLFLSVLLLWIGILWLVFMMFLTGRA